MNDFSRAAQPELLGSLEWDVACLQEVTRATWKDFRTPGDQGDVAFEYVPALAGPGPRYACAVLVRSPARVDDFSLLRDVPSPERAALAMVSIDGLRVWVGSWAAPPGVSWGKAGKGRQLERFAAWLRDRPGPVVVGIDRNAPKWDRHDLSEDEWWNDKEPLLYGPDRVHDLRDVYRDHLAANPELAAQVRQEYPEGPLAVTHRRRGIACRYDAIYASPEFTLTTSSTAGKKPGKPAATMRWCAPPYAGVKADAPRRTSP